MSSKTLVRLTTRTQTREDWTQNANCQDTDPEIFDPLTEAAAELAKNICAHCDVRRECLQYAMDNGEYGVWGGTTEKERRWLKRVGANHDTPAAPQQQKPPPQPPKPRANPSDHHHTIAKMRATGHTWTDIATAINAKPSLVRRYWNRHTAAKAREAARLARLPERLPNINPDNPTRPADHHHIVERMLTDTERNYTHREVAWVIGSTVEAVRSYWWRWNKEQREQVAA